MAEPTEQKLDSQGTSWEPFDKRFPDWAEILRTGTVQERTSVLEAIKEPSTMGLLMAFGPHLPDFKSSETFSSEM